MNNTRSTYSRRRASLSLISFNQMHYTNPWAALISSFFFPGCGYILLGEYIQGWMLFLWEFLVNLRAHFNVAIIQAFTGHYHESIQVLKAGGTYWILVYGSVFCYSLYGSYMLAVELNNQYSLAFEENAPLEIFKITAFQINFFDKRNPWVALFWSALMPGLGEMFNRKLVPSVFILGWWLFIIDKSHVLASLVYSLTGHFRQAVSMLDQEWILYMPSIYGFAFYTSYVSVVEQNKLFDKLQANYLSATYQSKRFPFRLLPGGKLMRIVSTFDHSPYLEKAIIGVRKLGVPEPQIYAVPINKNNVSPVLSMDSMHRSDGQSFLDIPALLAAFCCALGTIYGFVLYWGPVIWGLIGFAAGFASGCLIRLGLRLRAKKRMRTTESSKTEVVLLIDCTPEQAGSVEQILWNNQAFGVSLIGAESGA